MTTLGLLMGNRGFFPAELCEQGRKTILAVLKEEGITLAELEIPGYTPSKEPGIRGTQKYWSPTLAGVWARSPYLHNGSVRTMQELLTPPAARAKTFHRGSRIFDTAQMGYADAGR